jgi:hypothetical protein
MRRQPVPDRPGSGQCAAPGGIYAGSAYKVQGRVAERVQSCWFSGDPAFKRYSFDLDAHNEKNRAVIRIREGNLTEHLSGTANVVLRVDFITTRNNTRIDCFTLPPDPALARRMRSDIARWASGDKNCHPAFARS